MATPKWQPGHLYQPGDIVVPKTTHGVTATAILHPDFDAAGTDWAVVGDPTHAGWVFANVGAPPAGFVGNFVVEYGALGGSARLDNAVRAPVAVGQTITAHIQVNANNKPSSDGVSISMLWYDSGNVFIQEDFGPYLGGDGSSNYRQASVTAVAPANAAFASVGLRATRTAGSFLWLNHATWDYTYAAPPDALTYVAVQTLPGNSASTEPTWPTILGNTVVDNQVTWQAIVLSRVTWQATPITKSSTPEPTWPTTVGGSVVDGTVKWVATSRRITDTRCPNSKFVLIAASKIFAGDNDIAPFCATVNPLDWSTADDAGYLATGLQPNGANALAVLGVYRGNLVALNSGGFQMWQIDPDPANMALLDSQPVGSTFPKAVQAVANDLAFLTAQGVRNIGIAAASANLQVGGFGEPVDSLIKAYILAGQTPRSLYYPARGQYWLFFGTDAMVLTINGSKNYSWSRYIFPEAMTDWTMAGDVLYLRTSGNKVIAIDETALLDDKTTAVVTVSQATPAVVGLNAHARAVGDFVVFTTTGTLPAPLLPNTVYYVIAAGLGANSFEISATLGGAAIATTSAGSGVHTAQMGVPFHGILWWNYVDMGNIGTNKQMEGFDLVGTGTVDVSFGYDQRNVAILTPPFTMDADGLPGAGVIGMPLTGPSFALKLDYAPNQAWKWNAANIYITDDQGSA